MDKTKDTTNEYFKNHVNFVYGEIMNQFICQYATVKVGVSSKYSKKKILKISFKKIRNPPSGF